MEPSGGVPYIEYTENVSKNRPGGLKHRKIEPKKVKHLPNYQRPERCFVRLFKAYCAHHLPKVEHNSFYLTPLRNPRSIVWYQVTPVGHHTLANTVKWMCSSAGVDGYKTNHSLRVTTATKLFQSGVDQQCIMRTTGHLSMNGMWPYKRDSDQQQQVLSDILNLNPPSEEVSLKRRKIESPKKECIGTSAAEVSCKDAAYSSKHSDPCAVMKDMAPTINFSGCSGISIIYSFGKLL